VFLSKVNQFFGAKPQASSEKEEEVASYVRPPVNPASGRSVVIALSAFLSQQRDFLLQSSAAEKPEEASFYLYQKQIAEESFSLFHDPVLARLSDSGFLWRFTKLLREVDPSDDSLKSFCLRTAGMDVSASSCFGAFTFQVKKGDVILAFSFDDKKRRIKIDNMQGRRSELLSLSSRLAQSIRKNPLAYRRALRPAPLQL